MAPSKKPSVYITGDVEQAKEMAKRLAPKFFSIHAPLSPIDRIFMRGGDRTYHIPFPLPNFREPPKPWPELVTVWETPPRYDDSPEAWRLVWADWKRLNPHPWRNKRTRAKANKMLRAVRKGWKPPTVMVDILRMTEELRKAGSIFEDAPRVIPAIPKPEDF